MIEIGMDPAIKQARENRLREGLHSLAAWCKARAEGCHNADTTLTMLERKAKDLREAVNRAGHAAGAQRFLEDTWKLVEDPRDVYFDP